MADINATANQLANLPSVDIDSVPLDQFNQSGVSNVAGQIGPDITDSGTPPQNDPNQTYHISNWNNFTSSFGQAAATSIPSVFFKWAKNFSDQHLFDSPVASQEQIHEAQQGRPGFKVPNGATVDLLNSMTSNYDSSAVRENILAHSQPTVGGWLSGFVGSALGSTITDPVTTGLTIGAGALTKGADIPEIIGLERSATSLAINRFLQGSAEGAAFGASQAAGQQAARAEGGQDIEPIQALTTIGDNMLLGGALHPIGGALADIFKGNRFLPSENADDVNQSAANMANNGKDPQTETVIQNGFIQSSKQFQQKISDAGLQPQDVLDSLDDREQELQSQPDSIDKDLELKSIAVHRAMLTNTADSLSKDDLDNFVQMQQNTETDFANGRGQAEMDVTGPQTTNAEDLLNRDYPPEKQQELINNAPMDDDDQAELDDINNAPNRQKLLSQVLKSTFQCMLGAK